MALVDEAQLAAILADCEHAAGKSMTGPVSLLRVLVAMPEVAETLRASWEERDTYAHSIRQFEHARRVTAELNGDLWEMLVMALGVSLSCDNDGVEQARAAIKALKEERDEARFQARCFASRMREYSNLDGHTDLRKELLAGEEACPWLKEVVP